MWLPLLSLFVGCSLYPTASDWKRCSFEVASVRFAGFRENQSEWEITLNVHNPNSSRLKMEGIQLFALQEADTLATLKNQKPLDLAPNENTRVAMNISLPPAAWDKVVGTLRQGNKCSLTVNGDAYYHGWFGVKKLSGIFHKTYDLDLAAAMNMMGGNLFQGLQGLPFFR
ncbi:MAG TPA: hypothetical protein DCQ83_00080 [Fibrobacteres bacterium]|jgi:hypothetical protein|nr:hypothetical protein [Fibrobacterota bacterium]